MDMPETLTTEYQSISDMTPIERKVSGKKFYVQLAGKTDGAHLDFVQHLKGFGQVEVHLPEDSDYLVVFCPAVSRVGTDIGEALEDVPGDKATVLVVMHHTFNTNYVAAESRRQVDVHEHPNVLLTLDVLFFGNRLLKCNHNVIARTEVQKLLGVSPQVSSWENYIRKHYWTLLVAAGISLTVVIILAVLAVELREK